MSALLADWASLRGTETRGTGDREDDVWGPLLDEVLRQLLTLGLVLEAHPAIEPASGLFWSQPSTSDVGAVLLVVVLDTPPSNRPCLNGDRRDRRTTEGRDLAGLAHAGRQAIWP